MPGICDLFSAFATKCTAPAGRIFQRPPRNAWFSRSAISRACGCSGACAKRRTDSQAFGTNASTSRPYENRFVHRPHLNQKKSARELRQKGSNCRCCIPALAGFVSPQSIAPDGDELLAKFGCRAIAFALGLTSALTASGASGCIANMKWALVFLLVAGFTSCTTLSNRRDLYRSPAEGYERRTIKPAGERSQTTTTTTTTRESSQMPSFPEETALPQAGEE